MPARMVFDLIGFVCLCAIGSYALTWFARRISPRIGLVDRPDGTRKKHGRPVPLMGGVAVFATVALAACAAASLQLPWLVDDVSWRRIFPTLFFSAGILCAVGLWDDRHSLRPRTKLAWQIVAAVPWALAGRVLDPIQIAGVTIDLGLFGYVFVVCWLVACSNLINLVDGMDGLASTICLIISLTVTVLAVRSQMHGATFVSAVLAASLVGFLWHNLPPAKIFLGDAGSLALGFLVGALSLEASTKRATGLILTVPLVLMSIPIFDTVMAILRRKLNGRSIGQGDREHLHHRLQDRGWSPGRALLVIACLCVLTATAALVSVWLQSELVAFLACASIFGLLIVGRLFGYEEASHLLHYLRSVGRVLWLRAGLLRSELLWAQQQKEHTDRMSVLWTEMCRRTQKLGGDTLDVLCRDTRTNRLVWRKSWTQSRRAQDTARVGWEIEYSVYPKDGVRLVVVAQGTLDDTPPSAAIAELLHLSHKLYRSWRRLERMRADSAEPSALSDQPTADESETPTEPTTLRLSDHADDRRVPPGQRKAA